MSNHKAESSIYILTCLPSYILIFRRLANISTETHLSYSECIWGHWITTALQYIHWIYDSSITTWVWKDTWCIQWGEWHLARLLDWATLHSAGVDDVPHFAYKLCKQLQHAALSRINTCHILMAYRLSFVLLVYIRYCCSKWYTCSVTHTMIQFRLGQNNINLSAKLCIMKALLLNCSECSKRCITLVMYSSVACCPLLAGNKRYNQWWILCVRRL